MARLVLPSRLELKRPEGSSSEAPLAKVIFTTFLYVSPVQMIPACDHTGTPLHFHSSTTSGSACLIRVRTRESVLPRQSASSLIRASIIRDALVPFPRRGSGIPVAPTPARRLAGPPAHADESHRQADHVGHIDHTATHRLHEGNAAQHQREIR